MYILQLKIKSNKKLINIKNIILQLKEIKIKSIYKIKKKIKIFTVLKSPHVNKKSREQFSYKNYSQNIDISFNDFFDLINFLIFFKKSFSNNYIIKSKIKKCL